MLRFLLRRHIIAVLAAWLVLFVAPAEAEQRLRPPQITGDIVADTKANLAAVKTATGTAASALLTPDELWMKIQSASVNDLTYAKALADSIGSPGAKLRSTCYAAWITVIDQAQGTGLKDAKGDALTRPDPALFTTFEQLADVADNLQPTSPFMVACAPAWTALKMTAAQFISAAVTGTTTLATFGVAIP
jgi:hypothetical protein